MNILKRLIAGLLVVTAMTSVAAADAAPRIRHVEFSIAGSAQAFVGGGDAAFMVNMPLRVGAFIGQDFEVEAEGIASIAEGCSNTLVGYIISLNGLYNFPASERVLPFLLFGFGFANNTPIGNVYVESGCDGLGMSVLNAGFGWKFLFTPKAALRVEYRYQRFSGEFERWRAVYDGYHYRAQSYMDKFSFSVHSVFIGVSLFF